MRNKFAPVDSITKEAAMADFISGGFTVRQIGDKYGFNHRRLSIWFKETGRIDEFTRIVKLNQHRAWSVPTTLDVKLAISGQNSVNWAGHKLEAGLLGYYVLIPSPEHPHKNAQGYVYEHRLIMESHLGRYLTPDEHIHHINLNPSDNRIENLMVVTKRQHQLLHFYLQLALVELLSEIDLRNVSKHILTVIDNHTKRKIQEMKGYK